MLLFMAGFICLHFGMAVPATLLYSLASAFLLLAFAILMLSGIGVFLSGMLRDARRFFGPEAAAIRRLLAIYHQKNQQTRILLFKHRQIQYFSQFNRQRLLAADNKKQFRELYKAVNRELRAAKTTMPSAGYRVLRKALRDARGSADPAAILALRQRISCRD